MKKMITICDCTDCPNLAWDDGCMMCGGRNVVTEDGESFPAWCPLEDAPEDKDVDNAGDL